MRVIGIGGGTASGKSTLSRALVARLGDRAALLLHDRYYRDPPEGVDPAAWNYDHPDALETGLLVAHLDGLRQGQAVEVPRYDFSRHARAVGRERLEPRDVVVVEGILVLADERLRARMDLTVFVDTPADLRLARRLRRDVAERGRQPLGVIEQYLATVRPMHERHVAPSREQAAVVLDGTRPVGELVDAVLAWLGAPGLTPPATRGPGPSGR